MNQIIYPKLMHPRDQITAIISRINDFLSISANITRRDMPSCDIRTNYNLSIKNKIKVLRKILGNNSFFQFMGIFLNFPHCFGYLLHILPRTE